MHVYRYTATEIAPYFLLVFNPQKVTPDDDMPTGGPHLSIAMPGPGLGDRSLWCHRYGVMRVNACPCARECLTSYPQIHVVTRISIPLSNLYSRLFLIITHCLCATPFLQIRHSCISDHFTAKEFSRPRTSWYCTGANFSHQNLLRNFSLPVTYTFSSPLTSLHACAFHISLAIC